MNVATILPRLNSNSSTTLLTQQAGIIGKASALYVDQLRKTPSLREVAWALLNRRLDSLVHEPNPDILFINNQTSDGSFSSSVVLTDALLHALIHGVSAFRHDSVGFYMRHDSVDDAQRVPEMSVTNVLEIIEELVPRLLAAYNDSLDEFWSTTIESFDELTGAEELDRGTRHTMLSALQNATLNSEIELQHLQGVLTSDEKMRLTEVFDGLSETGVYRLSLEDSEGSFAELTTAFVVSQREETVDLLTAQSSEGVVFLHTCDRGLERFNSFSMLEKALAERLADPDARRFLLADLLLSDRARFDANTPERMGIRVHFAVVVKSLLNGRTLRLRRKQIQDLEYVFNDARQHNEDLAAFLRKTREVQYMQFFDIALEARLEELAGEVRRRARPHWLRTASEWERESYGVFEAEYLRRELAASEALAGLESLEAYALDKIKNYIHLHLGYLVDPARIFITLQDDIELRDGTLKYSHRKSLLEFAIEGLATPHPTLQPVIEVPEESRNAALTFEFMVKLIAELDIRHHYGQEMQDRYVQPATLRAMVHLRDSTISLSAWAAKLQGHLSDRGLALINTVSGDKIKPGFRSSLGRLSFGGARNYLQDLIVFHEIRDAGDPDVHYVLYAPGAPGGRDMFEFDSWRKLGFEVVSWLNGESGARYVLDQTAEGVRADISNFIFSIQSMPTRWREMSVGFIPFAGWNFEQSLSALVGFKIERYLAEQQIVTPGEYLEDSYADRQTLALFNARIAALNSAYSNITTLVSYRDYCHGQGKKMISDYLKTMGLHQTIDPDTVYFDVYSNVRDESPDFSRYTRLETLTSLFMKGYSNEYAFSDRAIMYSSIGQDLSELPLSFIDRKLRSALGTNYIDKISRELQDPGHQHYGRRRALFAKRKQFEMNRDALIERLNGRLTHDQYHWLMRCIVNFSSSQTDDDIGNSSVSSLHLNDRLIEGLLIFKDFDSADPAYSLTYTPGAPDGLLFRKTSDIVSTMQNSDMPNYYYLRASYKDQRVIGSLVDKLGKGDADGSNIARINGQHRITDLERLYDQTIERMIQDVDDQTSSAGELLLNLGYTVVKWTAIILLLPFPAGSLAVGLLDTSITLVRGYLAYCDGDRASALIFFAWGTYGLAMGGLGVKTVIEGGKNLVWAGVIWSGRKLSPHGKYNLLSA